ncbi:SpoIID/LytB domain protein [Aneurinibacillus soli]|uniref:Amidase enhancer n=1 Tax=Aneurinibacillus soli TaxID=1500254 RepID=A0A0U5AYE6_9BACL|nr:SpoIID/LytB domain-containing protein [Aneurinibacillus soli]PYE62461.1 SpoIID/LytB domain protein [Aneurinibacillus soli]BAU27024.1 Amidase enhancer precursor [Aneurinibacillus soli]
MKLGKVLPAILGMGLLLPVSANVAFADEPQVRVEVTTPFSLAASEVVTKVSFTVLDTYTVQGNSGVTLTPGQNYYVKIEAGKLRLYEDGLLPQLLTESSTSIIVEPTQPNTEQAVVQLKGKKSTYGYRDAMEFSLSTKGVLQTIASINNIDMEDYLRGVVPREMSSSWEREALKAQAVAARTYAMRQMKANPLINDTVKYQAYEGANIEGANSNAAVAETAGQVLMHDGKLIDALYSASNGGYTEGPENVWNGSPIPYLTAKPDPYDSTISPHKSWQVTLKAADIQSKIKSMKPATGTITGVTAQTDESGRVVDLAIQGDKGVVHLKKDATRTVLGLKSMRYSVQMNGGNQAGGTSVAQSLMTIDGNGTIANPNAVMVTSGNATKQVTGPIYVQSASGVKEAVTTTNSSASQPGTPLTSVTFTGSGWGHGVGMSQWGAKQMAKEGMTYQDILDFYYGPARAIGGYGAE